MSNTFITIIREVAEQIGHAEGKWVSRGTIASGTTTTLVDTTQLEDDTTDADATQYVNAWARLWDNSGTTVYDRRITTYTPSSGTLTWAGAAMTPEAGVDTYTLHYLCHPDLVENSINKTLRLNRYRTYHLLTQVVDGDMEDSTADPPNWTESASQTLSKSTTAAKIMFGVRSLRIQQNSQAITEYVASDAIISTCEFEHPHYWLQTRQLTLDESEDKRLARAVDSVFFVHGLPLWYWPYYARDLERDRTVLKRFRLRHSSEFGTEIRTAWDLYDLGLYDNDWSNLALVVDVLTERGVGLGLDFDYERWGGKGYFTSYYIDDSGEDFPGVPLQHRERGRFEWRHRQRLSPYDTLLAEFAWMSDRNFLDEYFEREAREDKEKETVLYYKHQRGLAALTALAKVRTNNFLTQTEYLPQVGVRLLGYPLGYSLWGDRLTLTSTSQLANVRLRPDDALQLPQPRAWRFDTLNELAMPLAWRFIHFVPFAVVRYTAYSDTPDALGLESGHSRDRFAAAVGFRSSATFWRVYQVSSRLWDLDGIRHIITPTVDFLHRFAVTAEPHELFQFDEVDPIDELQVISLGLRQRWQTRRLTRGYSPLASVDRRVVDWLVLDAELDVFPNRGRDNEGDLFGNMELDLIWRVSDHVAVLSDAELDLDDGFDWDLFNVALKVDRSPRLSFYLGHRYTRDVASSAFTAGFDYQLSQKWQLGVLWQYDLQADAALTHRLVLTRRLHRWLLEIAFERDEGEEEGEGDTSVSLTLIPQGLPETKLRFF